MDNEKKPPRVFISYSRTNTDGSDDEDNIQWVEELAIALQKGGIESIFDQGQLKPGDDQNEFMEKCVDDKSVNCVLVICNKNYETKANSRLGGVGAETRMLSQKVHSGNGNGRIIPIFREYSAKGEPYRPNYLSSFSGLNLSKGDELRYKRELQKLLLRIRDMKDELLAAEETPNDSNLDNFPVDTNSVFNTPTKITNRLSLLESFLSGKSKFLKFNGLVNRAEAAKFSVIAAGIPIDTTGGPHFNDVSPSQWSYNYIETLYNNGVIGGINGGMLDANGLATYNPQGAINRAECLKILVDAFNFENAYIDAPPNFLDVDPSAWYYYYVETAYANGLIDKTKNAKLKPKSKVNKDEFIAMVKAAMRLTVLQK